MEKASIKNSPTTLILGDNLFYGHNFISKLKKAYEDKKCSTIFAYSVNDPERYGVVNFDNNFRAISIDEEPNKPISNKIVTGLYFYDEYAVEYAKTLKPSKKGKLEITDLIIFILKIKSLKLKYLVGDMHGLILALLIHFKKPVNLYAQSKIGNA